MKDPIKEYIAARDEQVKKNMEDRNLRVNTSRFFEEIVRSNYVKNFTWAGVPILQLPSDLMVMQEIIWKVCPNYIIETGVAFGGMTVFYKTISSAMVIGIDVDIRAHTHEALRTHLYEGSDFNFVERIRLIEGSSIDPEILKQITYVKGAKVLVSLDSHHTHEHVLAELRLYSPLVSVGSYIVVFDTTIDTYGHFDPEHNKRPWGPENNPATAVRQFLRETDDFVVDREIEQRALITAAPGGYLRRVK
jgi:cephalosporin hydroxylase